MTACEVEEKLCRYCFGDDSDGELISPCNCSGGQKYVHLSCLRRWQRMVLVSQPTHPAYYRDDERHHRCNVCLSEYTCAPPTRHELMTSFTGPEIAALIEKDRIIVSRDVFSEMLEQQMRQNAFGALLGYRHWIRGVYLITNVRPDDDMITQRFTTLSKLDTFRNEILDANMRLTIEGREYAVAPAASLSNISSADLRNALFALSAPCTIALTPTTPATSGDDHISAVNLTRPIACPHLGQVESTVSALHSRYSHIDTVSLTHYNGGPCEPQAISTCLVPGGVNKYTLVANLDDALMLAYARAHKRHANQGDISIGQTVQIIGLVSRRDLNEHHGIAMKFDTASNRWAVAVDTGEQVKIKPTNLQPEEGANGRVYVFWGDARWTRTQLLGEIAKGDWGLTRVTSQDIMGKEDTWQKVISSGRLVFAPITEMTTEYIRGEGRAQMEALREGARLAAAEGGGMQEEEEM